MSSWWKKSALKQAEAIRTKQVTSRQIVQEHLDRIEEVNPKVNAIVRSLSEEALAAADRADQAVARGDALGALHGVPCTVKENIDLGGAPTTWGVAAMAEAIAPGDAPQVERLRAAGRHPDRAHEPARHGPTGEHRLAAPRAHLEPVGYDAHRRRLERRRGRRDRHGDEPARPGQ